MSGQKRYHAQGKIINARIKAKEKDGLSLDEQAGILGVSKTMLYMWMAGDSLPGRDRITNVAAFLGVDVTDILPRG